MAGMWILLRNPENRCALAKAFDSGDGLTSSKAETRIAEAIQMHEVTEERLQRNLSNASDESHPSRVLSNDFEDPPDASKSDEWGLEMLVQVGERWLTSLKSSKDTTDTHAAVLKLFEFLTASLCLFLIPDDQIPDMGPKQEFQYNSERQVNNNRRSLQTTVTAQELLVDCCLRI